MTRFSPRFLVAALLTFLSFLIQIRVGLVAGWRPDFLLATLLILTFFFDFLELILLTLFATLLVRWPISLETGLLVAIPLSVFWLKDFIWLKGLSRTTVVVALGIILFYIPSYPLVLSSLHLALNLFADVLAGVLWGTTLFIVFDYFYPRR